MASVFGFPAHARPGCTGDAAGHHRWESVSMNFRRHWGALTGTFKARRGQLDHGPIPADPPNVLPIRCSWVIASHVFHLYRVAEAAPVESACHRPRTTSGAYHDRRTCQSLFAGVTSTQWRGMGDSRATLIGLAEPRRHCHRDVRSTRPTRSTSHGPVPSRAFRF